MTDVLLEGETSLPADIPINEGPGDRSVEALPQQRKLTTVMLVFMTYIAVFGGGAYALEELISVAYPLLTFALITIVPFVSGLPCAMMTAELSSAMPQNGGYLIWVEEAFGYFWAFEEGWFQFVSRMLDLAIYPVMVSDYFDSLFELTSQTRVIVHAIVLLACTTLNVLGIQFVGTLSIVMALLSLTPFALLTVLGIPHWDPSTWIQLPHASVWDLNWGLWISVAVWNVSGFDSLGQVAGEMKYPKRYSFAMVVALIVIVITAILPLTVIVSVDTNYEGYYEGYFPIIAGNMAGPWLKVCFVIGACIAGFACTNTYVFLNAIMMSVWSHENYLDLYFLRMENRFKTPWLSIVLTSLGVFALTFFEFEELIQVDQALYACALLLEYFALVQLRYSQPDMQRPYKIPLSNFGLILFITPPCFMLVVVIIFSMSSSILTFACIVTSLATGPFVYLLVEWLKRIRRVKKTTATDESMEILSVPPQDLYSDDFDSDTLGAANSDLPDIDVKKH